MACTMISRPNSVGIPVWREQALGTRIGPCREPGVSEAGCRT